MIFDFSKQKTYAVLLMAGKGTRIDKKHPKQYMEVEGKELFLYAAERLDESPLIDYIIFVAPPGRIEETESIIEDNDLIKPYAVIEGSSLREESSKNAILYLHSNNCNPHSIVLIHDADRPNITDDLIERNVEAAKKSLAAITATRCVDSMVLLDNESKIKSYVDRTKLISVQTPQTFAFSLIYAAFLRATDLSLYTDEGSLVLKTTLTQPEIVEGSRENYKITTPADLALFEQERNKDESQ